MIYDVGGFILPWPNDRADVSDSAMGSAVARIAWAILGSAALFFLSGCAGPSTVRVQPGETEQSVLARLGKPTHVFQDADGSGHTLEYMQGPYGQTTYMAKIGSDNNVVSYEQVLTAEKFAMIQIGVSTKNDVLRLIGTPSDTSYLALPQLEVWSYPYKQNPVSDSMMHVHFDHRGIVQKLLNGPDFRRDPDPLGGFNMHGGGRRGR